MNYHEPWFFFKLINIRDTVQEVNQIYIGFEMEK